MGYVIACAKARHCRPGDMTGVPGQIDVSYAIGFLPEAAREPAHWNQEWRQPG